MINRPKQKWQVLTVICIGIFMATLDGSILNIANPSIASAFHVSISSVQWVVTAYILVITATLLLFGKLGDRIGGQKIYRNGFAVFTLGSLLCSLSSSLGVLVGSRLIQAIGASMMMATGIGIVSNTFPPAERGKALGLTASMVGMGNMTGPPLGGIILAKLSWPFIFLINVPIGLVGFILAVKLLPAQEINKTESAFDFTGTILLAAASALLVFSTNTAHGINYKLLVLGLALLLAFWRWEEYLENGLLDLELFKIPRFVFGNLLAFVAYSLQPFIIFLMPFYLERVMNLTPAYSGLLMAVTPIAMALTAPLAGSLSDRIGPGLLTPFSFLMLGLASVMLSALNESSSILYIGLCLGLFGMGMGAFGSPNNSAILGAVCREKAGYTGGFISMVRNFSFALGTAMSAGLFSLFFRSVSASHSYVASYAAATRHIYWISSILCLLGFILAVFTRIHLETKTVDNNVE
ncbi:MFS transporter [Syntrophomonas palmitatica]|uniref:MFS transporter n=1 Tax=Syntrophomonas palmitatica TaxID=402877 RepID=UPI0006D1FEDA|nr:MFS transporter [Syntrophomonas palmitatica]